MAALGSNLWTCISLKHYRRGTAEQEPRIGQPYRQLSTWIMSGLHNLKEIVFLSTQIISDSLGIVEITHWKQCISTLLIFFSDCSVQETVQKCTHIVSNKRGIRYTSLVNWCISLGIKDQHDMCVRDKMSAPTQSCSYSHSAISYSVICV